MPATLLQYKSKQPKPLKIVSLTTSHFQERVKAWSINLQTFNGGNGDAENASASHHGPKLPQFYNKVYARLLQMQQDRFWTPRTIDTACPNLLVRLASLNDSFTGIFITMTNILVLLPHLDNVIQENLTNRLSVTSLDDLPEFTAALQFQQIMEKIHEDSYVKNLTSACELNLDDFKSQLPSVLTNIECDATQLPRINLQPDLIGYLQSLPSQPLENILAILCNGYNFNLNTYMPATTHIQKLVYDLNAAIAFIKCEWVLIIHLICTLFRIDMRPISSEACCARVKNVVQYLIQPPDNMGPTDIIKRLLEKIPELKDMAETSYIKLNDYNNLAGVRITNTEILRDELLHSYIGTVTIRILVDRLLEAGVSPADIFQSMKKMAYDSYLFPAINQVVMIITQNTEPALFSETKLYQHFSSLLDMAFITPCAILLNQPHVALQTNEYFTDLAYFLESRFFISQHEVKSTSYTTTLPGKMTARSKLLQ